jgi:hypothetical protein
MNSLINVITTSFISTYMCYQVGAYAVYTWRHRKLSGRGKESLEQIARVVVLNMVFVCISTNFIFLSVIAIFFIPSADLICSIWQGMGLLSRGIDNWGHVSLLNF